MDTSTPLIAPETLSNPPAVPPKPISRSSNRSQDSVDPPLLPPKLPPGSNVSRRPSEQRNSSTKIKNLSTIELQTSCKSECSIKSDKQQSPIAIKPITLRELDLCYSGSFPIVVVAVSGHYGINSDIQISSMETLYVHLRKITDVVSALDSGGNKFTIPINTGCRFSLIQNTAEGSRYEGVKNLATSVNPPKIVSCTKPWSNGSIELGQGELLVLKGCKRDKELEAFSLSSEATKTLPFHCKAEFSADPSHVTMYLSDVIDNVPNPFPCKAFIHSNTHEQINTGSRRVMLVEQTTEVTLLCSSPFSNTRFELPVDLPGVFVSVVDTISDADQTQLHHFHTEVMSTYNPAYGAKVFIDDCTKSTYNLMASMRELVREGHEMRGISINVDSTVPMTPTRPLPELPDLSVRRAVPNCARVYEELDGYQQASEVSQNKRQVNKRFLSSLDEKQVTEMLRNMGLERYGEIFKEERVTGDIMCELTDEVLEKELKVHSKLHRIRLLKLVVGDMDAKPLVSGTS